ncbi:Tyrosine-protein phosphatase 1 [Cytospora mali]|uniref:protein-tyrosine-phosphatase n=1 Tax=Cytospora mali TaxID=578113 RepID=A0A194UNP5_CYTMA|nr:Tyrosine-protein phosphatase 1 [Valsa mali var. pyri (nom. inval.)]
MSPPEPRTTSERGTPTVYYNMKTARPPPASKSHTAHTFSSNSVSHARSQSNGHSKTAGTSASPMASPRGPLSLGNPCPPKLSPSVAPRHHLSTPVAQASAQEVRTPSPNYFGLHVESVDAHESGAIPQDRSSPSTSSVKSFGAAIPKQMALDANPDFEAFKRQADANRGRSSFNLGSSHFAGTTPFSLGSGAAIARPRAARWHTHDNNTATTPMLLTRTGSLAAEGTSRSKDAIPERMDVDNASINTHDSAYVSADSKRSSDASLNPPNLLNGARFESPSHFDSPFDKRTGLSKVDDRHPRLSLMHDKAEPPSPDPERFVKARAGTLPEVSEPSGPGMVSPTQLKDLLDCPSKDHVLLLDLRVSPQYAQSRIKGALNLCIPTTLLKRATFNLQKLQQTFQADSDQEAFARWRDMKHLVVYDAFSSEKRDAVSAMNTIKKFTNEGYTGQCFILRGGFNAFSAAYPALIEHGYTTEPKAGRPTLSLPGAAGAGHDMGRPSVAPVIGGVMLPATTNAANPFFANIRQNQDLVDGVGQMDVKVPQGTDMEALPRWLREAADAADHGKKVSDKFLNIELAEQSRMKGAYSYLNPGTAVGTGHEAAEKVQLSGIEKGGKNRYKDILPFEHARVRLEGKPDGACDYVNASHIKATRSHKRYIASQGPLPATFEDFWSVIWDQDVRVIVMLTAESEGGQLKCHPYWKDREFGPIKLRALSEKKVSLDIDKHHTQSTMATESSEFNNASAAAPQQEDAFGFGAAAAELSRRRANTTTTLDNSPQQSQAKTTTNNPSNSEAPYAIIRKFALSHSAHPFAPIREITHLHYPSWPDFGTPAQPSHLLALVDLANVMQRSSLPVDVASAFAQSPRQSELSSQENASTSSPKKRTRAQSGMPLSWWEEPEADQAARPMLVHCSAGCGRTGTFCTVDSVIDMLKRQRMRNIKKANANIEKKVRGHKLQPPPQRSDTDGDVTMAGLSFVQGSVRRGEEKHDPFDDAISPGTAAPPKSPPFPDVTMASPSPARSISSSDEEEDPYIDSSWIDDDTIDLITSTVSDFRCQRLSMVQTLRQFVLCYETVTEWVWRLQECGGPAGSVIGAPGTGAGGTAAMRARGRSGTVAHIGQHSSK